MSLCLSVILYLSICSLHVVPVRAVGHIDLLRREQEGRSLNISANRESQTGVGKKRAVFYAGVEGSGHHLLENVYEEMAKQYKIPYPVTNVFPSHTFHEVCAADAYNTDAYDNIDFSRVYGVSTLFTQWSYPCFHGTHLRRKKRQHPRLDLLKIAADAANVDLHVILMYRPLAECLAADCEHRQMESCENQSDTLASNAHILIEQIRQNFPDPGQVHCWKFGQMESMTNAVNLAYGESSGWSDNILDTVFQPADEHGYRLGRDKDGNVNKWADEEWWDMIEINEAEVPRIPDYYQKMLAHADKELQEVCRWAR